MGDHKSVLLDESIRLLNVRDGGTYLDLTLGRAGHASEILKRIPSGRLIGLDEDEEAVEESSKKLASIGRNFIVVRENFASIGDVLARMNVASVLGIVMDLGVSSPQFDEAARGFSYRLDATLDMRMDQRQELTAQTVVNAYPLSQLAKVFREYGEDPDAYIVAKAIVKAREKGPIVSTLQLADIIKSAKPWVSLEKKGHPAKQIFQAIRIEVNDELGSLKKALDAIPSLVAPTGVIAIISFHSLEDRLVKQKFRELTVVEGSRHEPYEAPGIIRAAPFVSLTKKPIEPSETEKESNHRAASAKLRAVQRKGVEKI
jgi:16S rRNA (cytosine1402-N4)-methyltransferase